MAKESTFYIQQDMGPEQIGEEVLGVPEDVLQLRQDAVDCLEGRVDIKIFDEDYQKKIKDYYKYSSTRYGSKYGLVAQRTKNTLDII
jgi:hypothetical protein